MNVTDGQPLTPPVVATHRKATGIFSVGDAASMELQEIAENGTNGPLLVALASDSHVSDIVEADMVGPLVPEDDPGGTGFGNSVTFQITASRGAKFLSFASMLICTNDGFTGVDGLRLPGRLGHSVTKYTRAYDAKTEINTQVYDDMVPPCQFLIAGIDPPVGGTGMSNPALAEGGVIMHNGGILEDTGDLDPDVHGWDDDEPVAKITVTRV